MCVCVCAHACVYVCVWGLWVDCHVHTHYTPSHSPTNTHSYLFVKLRVTVSDSGMMASADCSTATLQSPYHANTHAHRHTQTHSHIHFLPVCHHRVSNSLRFASLTSPSQSLCTAAGRGSRHTLTHTLLCSTPIFFGREETRSEQKQDSTAFFRFFDGELLLKFRQTFQGFCAESCFKEIRSIVITEGICTTRPASQPRDTQKVGRQNSQCGPMWWILEASEHAMFHWSVFGWE